MPQWYDDLPDGLKFAMILVPCVLYFSAWLYDFSRNGSMESIRELVNYQYPVVRRNGCLAILVTCGLLLATVFRPACWLIRVLLELIYRILRTVLLVPLARFIYERCGSSCCPGLSVWDRLKKPEVDLEARPAGRGGGVV